jgi:hypothetical protein
LQIDQLNKQILDMQDEMGKYKRANAKLKRQTENIIGGKNLINAKISTNDVGKKISLIK